jgi:NAD(P)-dependent dehydrogenase (short-subunit alcohol dehydrogenase family)
VTDTPAVRLIPGQEADGDRQEEEPHKRLTATDDMARCIVALWHPAPSWMTGSTLRMDGGESIVG